MRLAPFRARALAVTVALAVAIGCAGQPRFGSPNVPFRHKTHEDKEAFMGGEVVPVMGKLFRKFDAKGYSKFDCETCHGKDMDRVDFRMPNSLYALPAENTIGQAKEYDEKTTAFMMNEVVPTFA